MITTTKRASLSFFILPLLLLVITIARPLYAQEYIQEYRDTVNKFKPLNEKYNTDTVTSKTQVTPNSNNSVKQSYVNKSYQIPNYQDTINHNPRKHFARAATEWFMFQALPASFNYFIRKDPYSHITLNNWFKHLKPSAWAWDDNAFATNQIAHPYHGQLYFNAFRSNNYSFLQSSLATLAGSFIWETAGETQAPSINDLVNTTYGGIILGEITHRISQNVLSRPTSSLAERQGKEVLAFFINPVNGLNRLLDGRWGRVVKGAVIDSSKVKAEVDFGFRRFDTKDLDIITKGKTDYFVRLSLIYTNDNIENKKPFDDFYVNLEVGGDDSSFVNTVNVYASLYGKRIIKNLPGRHLGVLSANYDFYHNEAFFYGAQSMNYNVISNFSLGGKNRLTTTIGGGPVILAAVPDPYLLFGESRNYNYGPGVDVRGSGEISVLNRFKFGAQYHGGYFVTLSGNESHYFLHTASISGSLRLLKNFSLNMNSGYFRLEGNFKDYPDINKSYPFARFSLGYNVLF